jgi:hypothetical protein
MVATAGATSVRRGFTGQGFSLCFLKIRQKMDPIIFAQVPGMA